MVICQRLSATKPRFFLCFVLRVLCFVFCVFVFLCFWERSDILFRLAVVSVSQVYRVKDNVTYSVVIEEFDSERGGWGPYTADDVQVNSLTLSPPQQGLPGR